jgi:CubicO group peptidase (beta-lactamase class C family)
MDLRAELADWPVGSASAAVIGPDGDLDMVDDGRIYRWASATKMVTAIAVLDGSIEGVVGLDDEVGPPGSTLRHLLSHASGLAVDSDRILAKPGTRRVYSNRGIDLAAEHLAARTGRPFDDEVRERVLDLLDMKRTELIGAPAHGAHGPIADLAALAADLLKPTLLLPEVVELASTVAFPDLAGVLPGFGRQQPNDWGLGCEIRDHKQPHWTAPDNSPATFGHFGQSGSFLWVDPVAQLACVSLSDTDFGPWAADRWPRLSAAVLREYAN